MLCLHWLPSGIFLSLPFAGVEAGAQKADLLFDIAYQKLIHCRQCVAAGTPTSRLNGRSLLSEFID